MGALRLLLESHAMTRSFAEGDLDWEAQVVAAHHKLSVMEGRMIGHAEADPVLWKRATGRSTTRCCRPAGRTC